MNRGLVIAAIVALCPATARAHITMTSPEPRYPEDEQKESPCGRTGGPRTDRVTVLEPGARVVVRWDETIDHDSHYRIAFDRDGDDDLDEPVLTEGEWITPAGVEVLADHIADRPRGGVYEMEIELPQIECERCTLQLVQVMYGRRDPYYYQCADLALRCATPGCLDAPGVDAGAPSSDAGAAPIDASSGARDASVGGDAGAAAPVVESGGCAVGTTGSWPRGVLLLIAMGGLLQWRRRR